MPQGRVQFVPADFTVPTEFEGEGFRLVPLSPAHNERDYAAWTSSIQDIRATPGWEGWHWPKSMSLDENRADLERHARDFEKLRGFTYSVLSDDEVIGCVYIYPPLTEDHDARVKSWVRASRSEMEIELWQAVSVWLAERWPFTNPEYAPRE